MSKSSLALKSLHVDRLYGRRHDALRVEGLVSGINVIYGPNGQGKTTLGRGLHALVWPDSVAPHRPDLAGAFRLGDDEWRVDLNGTSARYQRDGVDAPAPPLADSGDRERYRLSLHHLLQSDGGGFARVVALDAAGGLDIEKAAAPLKVSASQPRKSKATDAARTTLAALTELQHAQAQLASDAASLGGLEVQQAQASGAADRRVLWDTAFEHAALREQVAEAERELEAFPPALAQAREDDVETLRMLRESLRDASDRLRQAEQDAQLANEALASNAVAQTDRVPLAALRTLHETVREADHALASLDAQLAGLRKQEASEAGRLPSADLDRLAAVSLDDITEADAYARLAARLIGAREEVAALDRVVEQVPTPHPLQTLDEAARLLRTWLRLDRPVQSPLTLRLAMLGAAVCAVVALALGLAVHPAGFALALGALFLAVLAVQLRPHADGQRADTEERLERLRLAPSEWTLQDVESALDEVERSRADAVLVDQVGARKDARLEVADLPTLQSSLEAHGARVAARLGFPLRTDGTDLAFAVEAVRLYQVARTQREGVEAARAETAAARAAALDQASSRLGVIELPPVSDLPALAAAIERVDAADRQAQAARADRDAALQRQANAARERDAAEAAIQSLFGRLALDPTEGEAAVERVAGQRLAYQTAAQSVSDARAQLASARRRLQAHPSYDPSHEEASAEHAAAERGRAATLADQAETLTAQVAELRTRIGQAEAAHAVETAAARHAHALDALVAERDRAVAARLGHLFTEATSRTSRERQVPAVVHRAGAILGTITAHRYGLTFDPARTEFVATDQQLGGGLTLDQLSSGTRLQLLLSVRIAFIEQCERGVCLPIVLDELLANSDEARARAITEAVVALCRQGRQVIYLTSQPDEVAKWQRVADATPDVDCAFFALGDAPSGDGAADPDTLPHPSLAVAVPPPAGLDHDAYGVRLEVPAWTGRDPVGALHLWYALDDPDELYEALRSGVARLGQALAAVRSGAADAVGLAHPQRLVALADALEAWQTAWRQGRGRLVDREALQASGAVSVNYIDSVPELAARVDGDGRALIDALRDGEVKGFRTNKTDDLEAYFLETGILDPAPQLSAEAVWGHVVARVGPACAQGHTSLNEVREFLARIATGPGAASPTEAAALNPHPGGDTHQTPPAERLWWIPRTVDEASDHLFAVRLPITKTQIDPRDYRRLFTTRLADLIEDWRQHHERCPLDVFDEYLLPDSWGALVPSDSSDGMAETLVDVSEQALMFFSEIDWDAEADRAGRPLSDDLRQALDSVALPDLMLRIATGH